MFPYDHNDRLSRAEMLLVGSSLFTLLTTLALPFVW
jgi:hypothetical protein